MRRADRLFQLVQLLRRDRLTTGAKLAQELGISLRTLYRDIADLQASGVPIEGEGGVGYRLPRHFDLPPMMFSVDEAEALALGLEMAAAWADPALAEAARSALAKLRGGFSDALKARLRYTALMAPDFHVPEATRAPLEDLRRAIRERCRLEVRYRDLKDQETVRILRPLGLAFWGGTWTLAAWCEARGAFRTFRADRLRAWTFLEPFPEAPGQEWADYLAQAEGR